MELQSDAKGFLVGTIVKTQDDLLTAQQDNYRVLTRIRADVSAIARALNAQSKMQARSSSSGAGGKRIAPTVSPAGRSSSGGRSSGSNATATSRAASAGGGRRATSSVVATSARDTKGRFVAGQGRHDGRRPTAAR